MALENEIAQLEAGSRDVLTMETQTIQEQDSEHHPFLAQIPEKEGMTELFEVQGFPLLLAQYAFRATSIDLFHCIERRSLLPN
jgi:hypothetical protein